MSLKSINPYTNLQIEEFDETSRLRISTSVTEKGIPSTETAKPSFGPRKYDSIPARSALSRRANSSEYFPGVNPKLAKALPIRDRRGMMML
jgi:hypothetical protein